LRFESLPAPHSLDLATLPETTLLFPDHPRMVVLPIGVHSGFLFDPRMVICVLRDPVDPRFFCPRLSFLIPTLDEDLLRPSFCHPPGFQQVLLSDFYERRPQPLARCRNAFGPPRYVPVVLRSATSFLRFPELLPPRHLRLSGSVAFSK